MRRRDFTIGLLSATAAGTVRAQQRSNQQHRIAIVIPAGPVASIDDPASRYWQAFWDELRRLGDVEGQNLIVERYSAEGPSAGYADLARQVVNRKPDVIVAATAITQAASAAAPTVPIVWVGADPIRAGLVTSLARPGGNITGVSVDAGIEIWGKRLQILKEAVPSASKVAVLATPTAWEIGDGKGLREASQRLEISLIPTLLQASASSEYQRVFAEMLQQRPDAIIISAAGEFLPSCQLIVELVEKSRLPAIYPWREYIEAGGLMAYEVDPGELGRRIADDVHEIVSGANPGDIPIYLPTKFDFVINLKAAKALGLVIPPTLLARADEVIE
jgi:putative tryptophan/tyrosine transport system substrate-binding protein